MGKKQGRLGEAEQYHRQLLATYLSIRAEEEMRDEHGALERIGTAQEAGSMSCPAA